MTVRKERIQADFNAIARCGALEGGGVTRLAFTDADQEARRCLAGAMEDAGLEVQVDALGNMRGRRAGSEDLSPVMVGSHLDTVPEGGHYDGVIGVLAALEVVRALNDAGIVTRRPVEVVNFSAEESSRFGVATLGSKAMTGKLAGEALQNLKDADGISLRSALEKAGFEPERLESARLAPGQAHAFVEMHIEQGPVLESEGAPVGLVTAIAAPTRFRVTIAGRADHSGTTPMGMRRDALAGAAEIVLGVERIAAGKAEGRTVGTVGALRVEPGVMNVVPARVELGIDLRDIDGPRKRRTAEQVQAMMREVADRRGLEVDWEVLCDDAPVPLSERIVSVLEEAAAAAGVQARKMPSGAGHDAMNLAAITEAGMIFVPSVGGISHNVAEKSRMDDIAAGTEVLLRAVTVLAGE
ncbi:MAG: Zn-dependent hydrolase [Desulfuromonas sp.]|uniref:M20 family metallo-hydrolase n=1 Tax=Desulfuromonas sp. TaxID=892 RepID=UPI000CAB57ED|nr:M20 family metallo-hydrolase [Desulfuromonas sp.]PLX81964.1 MAG: Zn-dependent hydrolase [Desulfuromonas sp.]